MRRAIIFEADRSGYDVDQVANKAITVKRLKEILDYYSDDDLVVLSHDNGYTYGSISKYVINTAYEDEEGNFELDY